jgi:hypothetical protein
MINRSFIKAELYSTSSAAGTLKTSIIKVKVKDILIVLSILTGDKSQYNAVNASHSTHLGLTKEQSIVDTMFVKYGGYFYSIDYIVPGTLTQLFLTLVKENG